MSKQFKDNTAGNAQESLVDALENIKSLLEKSESKLSAARESIAMANSSSSKAKALSSVSDDDIPVLDEEVIPTLVEEAEAALNSIPQVELPVMQGISSEDIMELLDEFQDRIPALLNRIITNCSLSSLEGDLFEALQKEINQLRNDIKQLDN